MTTCAEVIRDAYQKAGAMGPGQSLTQQNLTDGMQELQALFDGWTASGMFGQLTDISVSADYEAGEWERVTGGESLTITLPDEIDTRPPYDRALIVVVQGSSDDVYLRDARAGAWLAISSLSADDTCPLANLGRMGMAACLAERLGEIAPHDIRAARAFRGMLAGKHGSARREIEVDYF